MFRSYDVREMESWTSRTAIRGPRRLALVPGATTSLVVLLATALTAAAWRNADSARPADAGEGVAPPGSGFIVRFEALHLWLPETLGEFATQRARTPISRDHDAFRRFLEHRGQEKSRYAVTFRGHQVNGAWADITYLHSPYDDPRHFQVLMDILDGAGEEPDRAADVDLRGASVRIIPEALLNREPSAVIAAIQQIVD